MIHLLKGLGIKTIFSAGANFSNMTNQPGVYIGMIQQKANASVDESGIEAASVTVAGMMLGSSGHEREIKPIQLYCDRPFIFAISEKSSGTMLHLGVYR